MEDEARSRRKALKRPRENNSASAAIGTKHPINEDHPNSASATPAAATVSYGIKCLSEEHLKASEANSVPYFPGMDVDSMRGRWIKYPMVFPSSSSLQEDNHDDSILPAAPLENTALFPEGMIEPDYMPEEGFRYVNGMLVISRRRPDPFKADIAPPNIKGINLDEFLSKPGKHIFRADDPRWWCPMEEFCQETNPLYISGTKKA